MLTKQPCWKAEFNWSLICFDRQAVSLRTDCAKLDQKKYSPHFLRSSNYFFGLEFANFFSISRPRVGLTNQAHRILFVVSNRLFSGYKVLFAAADIQRGLLTSLTFLEYLSQVHDHTKQQTTSTQNSTSTSNQLSFFNTFVLSDLSPNSSASFNFI